MNKHTPGPWLIAKPKGNGVMHKIWRTNGDERNTGYARIARHVPFAADAQLIAAAPDLLEALKEWIGYVPSSTDKIEQARIDRAIAAIAKAEGN